jgi:choline kinase
MKAIILAADSGVSLYPYTKYIPPCLLDVGGKAILEHQIDQIRYSGIDKVVIVVGFKFEKVENLLKTYDRQGLLIKTLINPYYETTDSLLSLWIAKEFTEDVVVIDGNVVFDFGLLERALTLRSETICLPVKRKSIYDEEDTKVVIRGDRITEIGKTLSTSASAESVGIRVFRDRGFALLERTIEEEVRDHRPEKKCYVSAIQRLIDKGYKVKPIDIGDLYWIRIASTSDLANARINANKLIEKSQGERILRIV